VTLHIDIVDNYHYYLNYYVIFDYYYYLLDMVEIDQYYYLLLFNLHDIPVEMMEYIEDLN
jgi:hypothetical protein